MGILAYIVTVLSVLRYSGVGQLCRYHDLVLVFGIDQDLLLYHGSIANDHGYEIGILYVILW